MKKIKISRETVFVASGFVLILGGVLSKNTSLWTIGLVVVAVGMANAKKKNRQINT
ncbi:hypothetical protein GOV05_03075 [Candidatus Woesearchaeota archaeon]|nr:hypothetical protein [Candidatus Woesearchaeota archaeon]